MHFVQYREFDVIVWTSNMRLTKNGGYIDVRDPIFFSF